MFIIYRSIFIIMSSSSSSSLVYSHGWLVSLQTGSIGPVSNWFRINVELVQVFGSGSGTLPEPSSGAVWHELVQAFCLKFQAKYLNFFKSVCINTKFQYTCVNTCTICCLCPVSFFMQTRRFTPIKLDSLLSSTMSIVLQRCVSPRYDTRARGSGTAFLQNSMIYAIINLKIN